ncbi:MAG: DNA repair protein RecN [Cyclobacteriaceae bacterium]
MLKHLIIKNYALIESLEMSPSTGLNIITGETGAGKSIMVGATGLLLGHRADSKTLMDPGLKCIVEGTFDLSAYQLHPFFEQEDLDYQLETIIRREIRPNGKSRAFINDTPVTLDILRGLGNQLMDIHSQHETLLLARQSFQLNVLDAYAGNQKMLSDYQLAYNQYTAIAEKLSVKQQELSEIKKEADYRDFLLAEFDQAALKEGEQQQIEGELAIQENAEEIKTKLQMCLDALSNHEQAVNEQLPMITKWLNQLAVISNDYQALHQRLESVQLELKDITNELESLQHIIDHNPEQLQHLQERLSLIYQLQQKHQVHSIEALEQIHSDLQGKALMTDSLANEIDELQSKRQQANEKVEEKAVRLSKSRTKASLVFSKEVTKQLQTLGMPEARLEIAQTQMAPNEQGTDQIELLFSANKGVDPQPMRQVASGGEFSRLMFCLKYIIADKTAMPTVIFDEIDTGISGEVALKMIEMMRVMAQSHQVIAISHLPQFAAQGDAHYYVFKDQSKDKAASGIKKLEDQERILAVAKMLGGDQPSEVAMENAKEMLDRSF